MTTRNASAWLGVARRSANRRADARNPRSMGDVCTRLSLRWQWLRRGRAALLLRRKVERRQAPWYALAVLRGSERRDERAPTAGSPCPRVGRAADGARHPARAARAAAAAASAAGLRGGDLGGRARPQLACSHVGYGVWLGGSGRPDFGRAGTCDGYGRSDCGGRRGIAGYRGRTGVTRDGAG